MAITGFDNTYQKMMNNREIQTLKKLDFDVLSRAKTQLPLFHIYWKYHQLGTQIRFKLVQVGASETRKLAKVGFGKHSKKTSQKNIEICSKMVQKEGPEKVIFLWFFRVPSQHGL